MLSETKELKDNYCKGPAIAPPPAERPANWGAMRYDYEKKKWYVYCLLNWLCKNYPDLFICFEFRTDKDYDYDRFELPPKLSKRALTQKVNLVPDKEGNFDNLTYGYDVIIYVNELKGSSMAMPRQISCFVVWKEKAYNQFYIPIPYHPEKGAPVTDEKYESHETRRKIIQYTKETYENHSVILACGGNVPGGDGPEGLYFQKIQAFEDEMQIHHDNSQCKSENKRKNRMKVGCASKRQWITTLPAYCDFFGTLEDHARAVFFKKGSK